MKKPDPLSPRDDMPQPPADGRRESFATDFRRFFTRGLAAILPTLITIWLLFRAWDFLWESLGQNLIYLLENVWFALGFSGWVRYEPYGTIARILDPAYFSTRCLGVGLAILAVYVVGVVVGNLIGRTFWRFVERNVMRIPFIRAIYPAVKQITDFILAERHQMPGSRVIACKPHDNGIWQIGLMTGRGKWLLDDDGPEEMVTVFLPSTPTAFTGYVVIVPKSSCVELPMTVEEALRLLVSGGVIMPSPGTIQRLDPAIPTPSPAAMPSPVAGASPADPPAKPPVARAI